MDKDGNVLLVAAGSSFERIGLEAGPLSQWIYAGLADADLPAICVETRHMHAILSARINKTDRNDARGIAQMMRVGLFKAVHVKTPASQHRRFLLTSRKLLQKKIYGLKVGGVGAARFDHRVRELVTDHPTVAAIADPLLEARAVLQTQFDKPHKMLLQRKYPATRYKI